MVGRMCLTCDAQENFIVAGPGPGYTAITQLSQVSTVNAQHPATSGGQILLHHQFTMRGRVYAHGEKTLHCLQ